MQLRNKTRIKELEKLQGETQGEDKEVFIVVAYNTKGEEHTLTYEGKEYKIEEFKKLYPNADVFNVVLSK